MKTNLRLDTSGEARVGIADMITPFSFTVTPDGDVQAVAYPAVQREAEEFLSRYAQDPTAGEAFAFLRAALAPYLVKNGYRAERFADRYACIFHAGRTPTPRVQARALSQKDQKNERNNKADRRNRCKRPSRLRRF